MLTVLLSPKGSERQEEFLKVPSPDAQAREDSLVGSMSAPEAPLWETAASCSRLCTLFLEHLYRHLPALCFGSCPGWSPIAGCQAMFQLVYPNVVETGTLWQFHASGDMRPN